MLLQNTYRQVSCWTTKPAAFTKTMHTQNWKLPISEKVNTIIFIVNVIWIQWLCFIALCENAYSYRKNALQSLTAWFFGSMHSAMLQSVGLLQEWDFRWGPLLKLVIFPSFPLPLTSSSCILLQIWHSHRSTWLPRLLIQTDLDLYAGSICGGTSANRAHGASLCCQQMCSTAAWYRLAVPEK